MNKRFAITTLGELSIQLDDEPITGFTSRKAEAMMVYLAVEKGITHRRESLFTLLWPGMPEKSARNNLRQVLFSLRQVVPEVAAHGGDKGSVPLLLADRQTIQLNPAAAVDVDIHQIDQLLEQAQVHDHLNLGGCETCIHSLEKVVSLYQGSFLANFYLEDSAEFEDWAAAIREDYRSKVLHTLETLAEIYIQKGEFEQASSYAESQIKLDPLRESAYCQLMELYSKSGQRTEALRTYQRCARVLDLELGTTPSRETTALYEIISGEDLRQTTALPREGFIRGYQIREHLGSGHTGMVYRAFQPVINRDVAVKVIAPQFANHPDFIRRFEVEAQLVARLEHPYIVPLYDYWRDPTGAYLVMRWLKGGSLQSDLERGAWKPVPAVGLVDQITAALALAHRQGVVHCDIKPANILLDEESNAYLTDFGISILTGPLAHLSQSLHSGNGDSSSGSLGYISPETTRGLKTTPLADIYSLGVVLYELLTGVHPFPGVEGEALVQKHLTEPLPSVLELRPELPPTVDEVIQQATQKNPAQRYPDVEALAQAFQRAIIPERTTLPEVSEVLLEFRNPYKGLRPFDEADSIDFFGRDDLVDRLLGKLSPDDVTAGERFLAVVGPSGSGKSSLVKAGLIPAIRRGAIPGSEGWFVVEMTPGSHPLEELETALLRIAIETPEDLLAQLQLDPRGLLRVLRKALPGVEDEILLVIDQFEELFTLVEEEAERIHFIAMLAEAVNDPHSPLRLVITLRADFYDRPLQYGNFAELVREATEVVLPLNPEELERAICGPAEGVGTGLEPALVAQIIQDVGNQPGALPLLQYALTETFEQLEDHQLTLDAYEANGGVLGALGRRAEEIYTHLEESKQEIARQLFLRLVTLGEGTEETRRRVLLSEIESIRTHSPEAISPVIDQYGRYRLLTFDHDPATRAPTVEVAHEALLREWPRLRTWLDESRDDIRLQRMLGAATAEWQQSGRDAGFLLRGTRLDHFSLWMNDTYLTLTEGEYLYMEASLEKRNERQAVEAERQAHEAALEQRSRRFLRALVGVFAVATLVAIILTAFAIYQMNVAQTQARLASSRELSGAALLNLEEDPELSILLALQAESLSHTRQSEETLHQALQASRIRFSFPGDSVDYSPDGFRLATGDGDGIVWVWDAETGEQLLSWVGHTALINRIAFSPDGSYLATAGTDMTLKVWDAVTGELHLTLTDLEGKFFNALSFSPDGSRIAAASSDTINVWNAVSGELLLTREIPSGGFYFANDVHFSPDGEQLIAAGYDKQITVWDIASGDLLHTLPGSVTFAINPEGTRLALNTGQTVTMWDWEASLASASGQVLFTVISESNTFNDLIFSPDGAYLAASNQGGDTTLWNMAGEMVLNLRPAGAFQLAFSPDGSRLATSGNGGVKVWDITPGGGKEWLTLAEHTSQVQKVVYSPDGTRMVTVGWDGIGRIWDAFSGQLLHTLVGHSGIIWNVALSSDGTRVATAGEDNTARIWDASTGEELLTLTGPAQAPPVGGFFNGILKVAFSPDGGLLATAGADAVARVWDTSTGKEVMSLPVHPSDDRGATNVVFSPDGTRLVTTSDINTERGELDPLGIVWEIATGEELYTLNLPERTFGLIFSPDGKRLATAGVGGFLIIWDFETGQELLNLSGKSGTILDAVFSLDGEHLITSGEDPPIIWDRATGQELLTIPGHQGLVAGLALSPDGTRLATAGHDGTARVYLLDVEELIALAKTRVTRDFTPEECQQYLHMEECP